jgi:hypothetical protein
MPGANARTVKAVPANILNLRFILASLLASGMENLSPFSNILLALERCAMSFSWAVQQSEKPRTLLFVGFVRRKVKLCERFRPSLLQLCLKNGAGATLEA